MDFFRQHKKAIVAIIAASFIIWTFGMGLLIMFPKFGG